ncbi:MAG TPA: VCBS repeat-containing protein [Pyrinomonadaceae bacterium]|jgi:hypothetical protein
MRLLPRFTHAATLALALATILFSTHAQAETIADFDGDGKTDFSVWRSHEGHWLILQSSLMNLPKPVVGWGAYCLGDIAVPGDYDGDGKTDVAVYRTEEGNWYIIQSSNNAGIVRNWSGDPVQADYDGDGKTDIAVYRVNEGNWYIINSETNTSTVRNWGGVFGSNMDVPVPGDYDGDGKADIAVFRRQEGNWYVLRSTGGSSIVNWGGGNDSLVPADYDGDGMTDPAVFRFNENNWYIRLSSGGTIVRNWGGTTRRQQGGVTIVQNDQLVPGDYDGDGKVDIAVYRSYEGNWYVLRSSDGGVTMMYLQGDVPVPEAYSPEYFAADIPICGPQ